MTVSMVSVNIPFPGFYESVLSSELDRAEEMFCGDDSNELNAEDEQPEYLRLTSDDLLDCLFGAMDYAEAHDYLARKYTAAFDYVAGDALGISTADRRHNWHTGKDETYRRPSLRLEFEEMTSPREYNFTTDRIFVKIPLVIMKRLFAASEAGDHNTLAGVIADRFTSRSGFISSYSNDIADWLQKPLGEWDHNELGTLLLAALADAGLMDRDDYYSSLQGRISEHMDEAFYNAIDHACDFPKYEALKAEKRERLAVDAGDVADYGVIATSGQGSLTL